MFPVLANFIGALLVVIVVKLVLLLVAIAYYTLAERKIMAAVQRRFGPNVVGLWGLLQPLADGLKLFGKELVIPSHANSRIFILAPLAVLTLALTAWYVIPFNLFDHSERMSVDTVIQLASSYDTHLSDPAAILPDDSTAPFDVPCTADLPSADSGVKRVSPAPSMLERVHALYSAATEWLSSFAFVRHLRRLYDYFFRASESSAPDSSGFRVKPPTPKPSTPKTPSGGTAARPSSRPSPLRTAGEFSAYKLYQEQKQRPLEPLRPAQGPINTNYWVVFGPTAYVRADGQHTVVQCWKEQMLTPDDYEVAVLPPERPLPDEFIDSFSLHVDDSSEAFNYHFQGAQSASFDENQVRTQLFIEGFYSLDEDGMDARMRAPITGDVHLAFQEATAVLRRGFAPKGAYETQARFDVRLERYIDDFHRPINRSIRHAELRAKFVDLNPRSEDLWADFRRLSPDIDRGPFSQLAKAARKGRSFARLNEVRLRRDQTRRFNPESAPWYTGQAVPPTGRSFTSREGFSVRFVWPSLAPSKVFAPAKPAPTPVEFQRGAYFWTSAEELARRLPCRKFPPLD